MSKCTGGGAEGVSAQFHWNGFHVIIYFFRTSWVIEGNKMVVYNSKGKKIGKSGKAPFVCVVSNKEGKFL